MSVLAIGHDCAHIGLANDRLPRADETARMSMRRIALAALLALTTTTLLAPTTASADPSGYPWCIIYTGDDARLCDYPTKAACDATASGNVGYCTPNPAYFSSNEQAYGQAYQSPYPQPRPPLSRRR
jgi:Protein of unknown function (DUF3551)